MNDKAIILYQGAVILAQRYEALSEFIAGLTNPKPDFDQEWLRPLIERSPAVFGALAAIPIIANLILLYQLAK